MTKKWKLACAHEPISYEDYRCPLTEMGCFSLCEALQLIDFYLERALIDSCKFDSTLASYGWVGFPKLGKLEKAIKDEIGILDNEFLIAKTATFPETLARFGYKKAAPVCIECPRIAMTIEFTVSEGVLRARKGKTRMECFLRHIRNAIAHGNTFLFPNKNILLLDFDRNGSTTAFMLIQSKSLIRIMRIIQQGPDL